MKVFLLFTIIYPKINMNVVKFVSAVICRRTLEKIQISFGSCPVPRRISKAAVYFSVVTSWPNWKIPFRHGRTFRLLYSCIGTWALSSYLSCRLYRVSFTLSILPSNLNIRVQVPWKSHLKVLSRKESIESLQSKKLNSIGNSIEQISVKRLRDFSTQINIV